MLLRSNDAIAQVQEGILVDANASWLELVGALSADAITGQPIMDFFDDATHAALKGALIACLQGRWSDHSLKVDALMTDGSSVPLDLNLALGERDGEACVRLIVPAQKRDDRQLATDLADAVKRSPHTGLLYRQPLLESMCQYRAVVVICCASAPTISRRSNATWVPWRATNSSRAWRRL